MAVIPPSNGFDEGFGFLGWETGAYGTAVLTLDNWWRPISNTLRRRDEPIAVEGATGSYSDMLFTGASTFNNRWIWGTKNVSGTVVVQGEYDDIGLLLSNAMAHPITTQLGGGDTGAFIHLFQMAQARVATMPTSFTAQNVRGNIQGGGGVTPDRRFTGCMVDRLTISSRENRVVAVSADIIAQDSARTDDSITTANVSTAPWIEFHHSIVRRDAALSTPDASDNLSAGPDAIDWTLEIRNNLRAVGSSGRYLGAAGNYNVIRPPVYSGLREVMLTFNADYYDENQDLLMYTQALAGSGVRSWQVFSDSGILIPGTTKNFQLTFDIPRGLVLGDSTEYGGGPGIINQPVRVKSVAGATNLLVATLQNGTDNDTNGDLVGDTYLGTSN